MNNNAERFKFRALSEIEVNTRRSYLIKGLIPREGLVPIWGPPKCGKTFIAIDMLMHVSLDWPYRGRRVHSGAVMYCAFEGGSGYGQRIAAFRQLHGVAETAGARFYLMADQLDLINDVNELVASIERQLGGEKPVAVVLDTLNRSLSGSESSDEDMAKYRSAADRIQFYFGCVVILIHHCGIDDRRPRGHTSLTGAADAQIAVKKDSAGNVVAEVEYMKDGPEGATIMSRLQVVEVGTDEDGEAISSCVIEAIGDDQAEQSSSRKGRSAQRGLSDRQSLAMKALANAINTNGAPLPEFFGIPNTVAVQLTDWRQEIYSRGVLKADAANPSSDFTRLVQALQDRELIAQRDKMVWLVQPTG